MTKPRAQGLVLVFHCVPHEIEPAIEAFWRMLRSHLQRQGQELLLLSTAKVRDTELPFLGIPFHLTEFAEHPEDHKSFFSDHPMVDVLQDWYRLNNLEALEIYRRVRTFTDFLLDSVGPAAVISWQSAHPLSRIVRESCLIRDIAWWSAERGWLKDTLMLDLCENNVLTELNRSVASQRAMQRYQPPQGLVDRLRTRSNGNASAGRYPTGERQESRSIREQLGIGMDVSVWALFTHGEPHVNALAPNIRMAHGMDVAYLNSTIRQLSRVLSQRNAVLVVREHPFNVLNDRHVQVGGLDNVYRHDGDLNDLMREADVGLFTLSTLQFQWVFEGKPMGLLCNGLLSGEGMAPQWSDCLSPEEFVRDCLDLQAWPERLLALERRVAFLYESQLLELNGDDLADSAMEVAKLLSGHSGIRLTDALHGLQMFIEQQSSP